MVRKQTRIGNPGREWACKPEQTIFYKCKNTLDFSLCLCTSHSLLNIDWINCWVYLLFQGKDMKILQNVTRSIDLWDFGWHKVHKVIHLFHRMWALALYMYIKIYKIAGVTLLSKCHPFVHMGNIWIMEQLNNHTCKSTAYSGFACVLQFTQHIKPKPNKLHNYYKSCSWKGKVIPEMKNNRNTWDSLAEEN